MFPRRNVGSQGSASLAGHPLQRDPSPTRSPPCGPTRLLSKGPARLACSATFMLCGLEQGLALSEPYLTHRLTSNTTAHRKESGHMHMIRHACFHIQHTFTWQSHMLNVHGTHPCTLNTLSLYIPRPSFMPLVYTRRTSSHRCVQPQLLSLDPWTPGTPACPDLSSLPTADDRV